LTASRFFDLTGRAAVVTGGGAGLGLVFAEALAEAGADVLICGRNGERCEEAAANLEQTNGVRALGMHCDVRSETDAAAVVERAKTELGRIDILVNNAGKYGK
jgi:NAD(P)-dependent dehydrogenase (short-subunit alcohol dehydrogenase family)